MVISQVDHTDKMYLPFEAGRRACFRLKSVAVGRLPPSLGGFQYRFLLENQRQVLFSDRGVSLTGRVLYHFQGIPYTGDLGPLELVDYQYHSFSELS